MLLFVLSAWADPLFSVERGLYDAAFDLEITGAGTIYYSLDGSEPGVPYSGPIPISGTALVRAKEVAGDGTVSATVTHTYLFVADVLASGLLSSVVLQSYGPEVEASLRGLPTISIQGSLNSSYETPISMEWIDPDGDDAQVNCGGRLVGNTSLGYAKNSIRTTFRDDYGAPKWEFDLYGEDATGVRPATEHDNLTLRSGNHDSVFYLGAQGQYLRNFWMDESQLEMGHLAPHGRFAHLYLNGAYHGVYHVRERFNAAFLAEYLDGDEEDYEAISSGSAFDGSGAAWNQLVAASYDFEEAKQWLDVDNLLDYMILNYFAGNAWDWYPTWNWISAGPTAPNQGGFKFHSSDSDICLYYDWTVNILYLQGPGYVFGNLVGERHPDFMVALADAIHRNLEGDGPLTVAATTARYSRLAAQAEDAMLVESARWGGGWWDRDEEWINERNRLLNDYFPYRTDELLRQVQAAGWYPLSAPSFSLAAGIVDAGTTLTVTGPPEAELWVRTDGQDPREPGGAVAAEASGPDYAQVVQVDHSRRILARLRQGDTWGPVEEVFYEVDEAPPVLLNEWNAVEADKTLSGGDSAFGALVGNGGDWIELLVMADTDLRGWRITLADRRGDAGTLIFTDDPLLASVRAGTILTIAEDLPEDPAYDPDAGDWRFHLRATADGAYVQSEGFEVSHLDWTFTLWDADGAIRFGPAGETIAPQDGIASTEVGLLAADPTAAVRRTSVEYTDGDSSTFGSPNVWGDQVQDLSELRGTAPGTVGEWGEDSEPVEEEVVQKEDAPLPTGCGCSTSTPTPMWGLLALLFLRRRAALVGLIGCATPTPAPTPEDSAAPTDSAPAATCFDDADLDQFGDPLASGPCTGNRVADATDCDDADGAIHPGAVEVCDGLDNDCDSVIDDDPIDGLPFYADGDGDGYGIDALSTACTLSAGFSLSGGDCDDADASVHPFATESCDDIDQDCDGLSGDALGLTAECPATTCAEIYAQGDTDDGAKWLALPSGEVAQIWCDLAGGGWTLAMVRNSASITNHGDFGSGYLDIGALSVSPAAASSSSTALTGWLDLNTFSYETLRLSAAYSGSTTYVSRDISRDALRRDFGEDGYLLYGEEGYYWCGGYAAYTDSGIGAVNNPEGAPADCKGHGLLGSGWDFSESAYANAGLTLCGADGSYWLYAGWANYLMYYGTVGGAQAIWVK